MFFNDFNASDLACENQRCDRGGKMESTFSEMGMMIYKTTFDPKEKNGLLPRDAYYGIECGPIWQMDRIKAECVTQIVAQKLMLLGKTIAEKKNDICVMVAGIGNRQMTADAIGPESADRIEVRIKAIDGGARVCVLSPGVPGQTGMCTASVIKAAALSCGADLVLAVDSLRASSPRRLGAFIQLSNCGISPGSGVYSSAKPVNYSSIGVPVIAIGIPTVIGVSSIITNGEDNEIAANDMIVTSRECDAVTHIGASLIAEAINRALLPNR
ncbi:MAG: GPR endopeptidase [Clostridia bacterium]|nr:GPR endopeptidase [Clostridia bacterium]